MANKSIKLDLAEQPKVVLDSLLESGMITEQDIENSKEDKVAIERFEEVVVDLKSSLKKIKLEDGEVFVIALSSEGEFKGKVYQGVTLPKVIIKAMKM